MTFEERAIEGQRYGFGRLASFDFDPRTYRLAVTHPTGWVEQWVCTRRWHDAPNALLEVYAVRDTGQNPLTADRHLIIREGEE